MATLKERSPNASSMANHILPTSANLLGICFLIFSLVRTHADHRSTILDECAATGVVVFLAASLLSYSSLRSPENARFERWADRTFMFGLCILALSSVVLLLDFLK